MLSETPLYAIIVYHAKLGLVDMRCGSYLS